MGKFLTTVKPDFEIGAATGSAYSDNDWLFDWTPFEIPIGAAELRSINATVAGTDGAAGNTHDMNLYFAKSINGVAPNATVIHAGLSGTKTAPFRKNIIGWKELDLSGLDDDDHMIGYSVLGQQIGNAITLPESQMILQNDDRGYKSTLGPGYQTIWVAAVAHGAFNFGSDVQLNQAGHQAAATAATQITVEQGGEGSGDPRVTFSTGDILIGATGGPTMEVVSVDSATLITVKNISEQIDNNEELVLQYPIEFHFGFEY